MTDENNIKSLFPCARDINTDISKLELLKGLHDGNKDINKALPILAYNFFKQSVAFLANCNQFFPIIHACAMKYLNQKDKSNLVIPH